MAKKRAKKAGAEKPPAAKRAYFKQADFPQTNLQQAQKIASALVDNYAGKDAPPPDLAIALGVSPTSSAWPALTGAAVAYGLTEGGVNANNLSNPIFKISFRWKQWSRARRSS